LAVIIIVVLFYRAEIRIGVGIVRGLSPC